MTPIVIGKAQHFVALALCGAAAAFWVFYGLRVAYGSLRMPWLKNFAPAADAECPKISVIFAARDEEEKLAMALATSAALDYPGLEIMAVNDRSSDATGRILDDFAAADRRIKPLHIRELPAGWLGKPHALYEGYKASNGDWLLFTDADVRFRPDVLRRAMKLVHEQKLDHVTLLADAEMHGFWETALLTFFGLMFHLGNNVPAVGNPHSRAYVGVGAFQLMSRKAYEASGTHRRLALEVIDDMKLAKIVKQAGFRSGAAVAGEAVVVRWHAGLRNLIRGTTKNFFAAFGYRLSFAIVTITGLLVVNVLPFVGVVLGDGWVRVLCATCVAIALAFHVGVDWAMRVSPLYALTYPLGALFFTYMVMRSIAVTLWQGGVTWRETFYPLEELKRGVV